MDWNFVQDTLTGLGLPQHLVRVIMFCITTSSFKLLWNGEKSESFSPLRGLRQGDPLSPYIFVLCLECLGQLIQQVMRGAWKPIQLLIEGPQLSHLCFADDLILFAQAELNQANLINHCLQVFCKDSGQKISYEKSSLVVSKNITIAFTEVLNSTLGIPAAN